MPDKQLHMTSVVFAPSADWIQPRSMDEQSAVTLSRVDQGPGQVGCKSPCIVWSNLWFLPCSSRR